MLINLKLGKVSEVFISYFSHVFVSLLIYLIIPATFFCSKVYLLMDHLGR